MGSSLSNWITFLASDKVPSLKSNCIPNANTYEWQNYMNWKLISCPDLGYFGLIWNMYNLTKTMTYLYMYTVTNMFTNWLVYKVYFPSFKLTLCLFWSQSEQLNFRVRIWTTLAWFRMWPSSERCIPTWWGPPCRTGPPSRPLTRSTAWSPNVKYTDRETPMKLK